VRLIVVGIVGAVLGLFLLASDAGAEEILGFNEDAVAGAHNVAPDQYAGIVRAAGGNALRTNLDWRLAEPEPGVWDEVWWASWKQLYDAALARGVRPIFVIGFAPSWAREPGVRCEMPIWLPLIHEPSTACEMPPRRAMDAEWAEYAAEVARRFPEAAIEVWNEPNTDDYWRPAPDPARYAELLTLAYHAIKSVSPRTEVISGGLLNVRRTDPVKGEISVRDFISVAYRTTPSIAGSSDFIGLHAYPAGASVGAGSRFRRAFGDVRAIRDANGQRTPILVTETGVSTTDLLFSRERRQADAIERIQATTEAMPDVAGVVYHRIIEPRDSSPDPREHGYAWLRYGGSPLEPRQVFCRFVARAGRSYPAC
jgi:hypothetical protein